MTALLFVNTYDNESNDLAKLMTRDLIVSKGIQVIRLDVEKYIATAKEKWGVKRVPCLYVRGTCIYGYHGIKSELGLVPSEIVDDFEQPPPPTQLKPSTQYNSDYANTATTTTLSDLEFEFEEPK